MKMTKQIIFCWCYW